MDLETLRGILLACGEAKVSELKIGELVLKFGLTDPSKLAPPPAAEIADSEKKSLLQDEQKHKQDQLENMLLESPEEYEELLLRGELTDGAGAE